MKKVLVTGAAGFIGRHVLDALAQWESEIHCIDIREPNGQLGDRVNWHLCNLHDPLAVTDLMNQLRPTHLLHLAWYVDHGKYAYSSENFRWLSSSLHLADEFIRCGGERLVTAGTCAEYEWTTDIYHEYDSVARPQTIYGSAKLSLQLMTSSMAVRASIPAAHGRVFYVFGPGEHPDRLIPYLIRTIDEGGTVTLKNKKKRRDFIYVKDVARAFASLLFSDVNGPVNLGLGSGKSTEDVAKIVSDILGKPVLLKIVSDAGTADEPDSIVAHDARLRNELGFQAEYSVESALAELIEDK